MYLSLIIICILLYYFSNSKLDKKVIKRYIIFVTVLLVTASGLRHEAVGNDTLAYMRHFDKIMDLSWSEIFDGFWDAYLNPGHGENGKDPGQGVIIKLLTYIVPDSRTFLFVSAALLLVPLAVFVYRYSDTLETPCFFYVFYITMFYGYLPNSAIRQSFALAVLLIGYMLLQKRKIFKFLVCLFLASLFHKSSIIAIMMLPFYYFKNTKALYYWSLLLFVVMLFTYEYIGLFLSMQSEIYEQYGTGAYYLRGNTSPYMVIVLMTGLYLLGLFGINKDKDVYDKRLIYGGSAMSLVWVVMARLDPSLIRIVSYFGVWMGLMVPSVTKLWTKKFFYPILFIILLIFIIRAIITPNNYAFFWEYMQLHERYR